MTTLTITFSGPTKAAINVTGSGFWRMGAGLPDVFAEFDGARASVVIANGCVGKASSAGPSSILNAPIAGTFSAWSGGVQVVKPTSVTIRYGCAEVVRLGAATAYAPADPWRQFWLAGLPTDASALSLVNMRLEDTDFGFDDTGFQNPDQSGSARVCQSAWAGSIAAALGIDIDRVRAGAEAFTDFQLRWRHAFFYDADGKPLRADEHPWWRVGPSGWDGATKLLIDSPYKFETVQHLAPDRFLELAVGFNDFAARLYAAAYIEAVLTRPEFRVGQLADDQRSHGYCLRLAALWTLAGLGNAARDAALMRVVDGWRKANGKAFTGQPYPSIAPAHTGKWSHGYPSLVDWLPYAKAHSFALPPGLAMPQPGETCDHLRPWLKAEAIARDLPADAFTDGKDGLWQGHAIVWQTAVALGALCSLRDVPAAHALVPDVNALIQHATACIVGPGRAPGGIGPTGITLTPNPVYDAYVSRFPQRVAAGGGKNGTTTWICNPLLRAMSSLGPGLRSAALDLAETIWAATDYPSPPSLETMGLLPISTFGVKS